MSQHLAQHRAGLADDPRPIVQVFVPIRRRPDDCISRARAQSARDHVVNGSRVLEYNRVSMVLRKLNPSSRAAAVPSTSMRARYSGSVHARATIWAPFAVIQASSACSVNSATKCRDVGLPPEHDFQCGCPILRRCGCFSFCIRHGIEHRWMCSASHRSRRSVNVASRQRLDCLLGKGGLM